MPRRPIRSEASGFVLVGVVIFVLALVILGLSLFSLSSYEGQFVERTKESDAAFYAASSGIEHAKFAIARSESLGLVSASLFPTPEVVYARAQRLDNGDTVGSIKDMPEGTPIEIRVMARVRNQRRMIQARFIPVQTDNVYKRLISAQDGIQIGAFFDGIPAMPTCGRVYLDGKIRVTNTDASWMACASVNPGAVTNDDVPLPDLASYWARFWDMATEVETDPGNKIQLTNGATLPGGPADVEFFKTTQDPNNDVVVGENPLDFSVSFVDRQGTKPRIRTNGDGPRTYVWLLDHGIRVAQGMDLFSDDGDCLVIVARHVRKPGSDHIGIWFPYPMNNQNNCPVILVSDAEVHYGFEPPGPHDQPGRLNHVSIFAKAVWLGGPFDPPIPGTDLIVRHLEGTTYDQKNGLIDRLCELGALPNTESGGMRFDVAEDGWAELNPDYPDNPPY
jgi:hypothetical protein